MDVEHETTHYCGWSVALTNGQGIPDHIDTPSEQYGGIARMICAALAEGQHTDPDKSVTKGKLDKYEKECDVWCDCDRDRDLTS